MSLDLDRLIGRVESWKRKYHDKALSEDATYVNWVRTLDTGTLFTQWAWREVFQYGYANIAFSLSLDIPPIEMEPLNLEFKVNLPTVEQLLQGILIDISPYKLEYDYPWLTSVEAFLSVNLEAPHAESFEETRVKKAYYGVTRYGRSYYDPVLVREFLRATLAKRFLEKKALETARSEIKVLAETLGLHPDVANHIFTRIDLITRGQYENFILGYGVLGYSKLGRRGSLSPFPCVDIEGRYREVQANTLDHLQVGFILGISCLGLAALAPVRSTYKASPPPIIDVLVRKVLRLRDTYTFTSFAVANYQDVYERREYTRSHRANQYMDLMLMRVHIENIVQGVIGRHDVDGFKARMYKLAALQLIGTPTKRHAWGYSTFRYMGDEELKSWWIKHWTSQGLDESILNEIWDALSRLLKPLRQAKLEKSLRVKLERYMLAQLS